MQMEVTERLDMDRTRTNFSRANDHIARRVDLGLQRRDQFVLERLQAVNR